MGDLADVAVAPAHFSATAGPKRRRASGSASTRNASLARRVLETPQPGLLMRHARRRVWVRLWDASGTVVSELGGGTKLVLPGSQDASRRDASEVATGLDSDVSSGLSAGQAAARLARFGPNRLEAAERVPTWRRLLAHFADPLVYLLLVAIVVSLVAWMLEGRDEAPFDAIVIAVIVIANAVLGYVQEARAEQAVAALQRLAAATAGVVRDGREVRVSAADVVPGDVLLLAEGDAVAADARLVEAASLMVAEASLTGESEPVLKDAAPIAEPVGLADRLNMVFSGTAVVRGRARAVVTATGMATETGNVARLLERTDEQVTPL
ncbi:MAG TPA: HAD-IC family P-type ATPase, partial [Solirubrobacteraceae bacterium]|nr:HAD-IC family P-type ATPase [Solirubrobacteraceae bacterium]